jgi:hypothetical protein
MSIIETRQKEDAVLPDFRLAGAGKVVVMGTNFDKVTPTPKASSSTIPIRVPLRDHTMVVCENWIVS